MDLNTKLTLIAVAIVFATFGNSKIIAASQISNHPSGVTNNHRLDDWLQTFRLQQRPIRFTDLRERLTLDYIRLHYDPQALDTSFVPRMIVIHWTGTSSLSSSFTTLDTEILPSSRSELRKGGLLNVSTHFLVDRSGEIYQLLPETKVARHVIGLNHVAIGIENVGSGRFPLTEEQLFSNAQLVRYLTARHPTIRFIIGHHEYQKFRGTSLWKERIAGYITSKQDPGPLFMSQLRSLLVDLQLCEAYNPPNCR